jgi:hypothetical protein
MTQPDDLQQAYSRAMAHNAMLREALTEAYREINEISARTGSPRNQLGMPMVDEDYFLAVVDKSRNALNATEADSTAWEKKLREQVMLAVHPLQPEYEKLQQQLATVTERDALQDLLGNFEEQCIIRPTDGGWVVYTIGLELWMDKRSETLNQSPPSE